LHNITPIYSTWGLLSVCATCPTPHLNQSYELRPPWEQHLRYVPHRVRNGYNKAPDKYLKKEFIVKPLTAYRQNSALRKPTKTIQITVDTHEDIENMHGEMPEKMSRS